MKTLDIIHLILMAIVAIWVIYQFDYFNKQAEIFKEYVEKWEKEHDKTKED